MTIKPLTEEIALSTANSVSTASVVRLYNGTQGDALVTRMDADENTIATVTMPAGSIAVIEKLPTDKLSSNVAIRAVSIAYSSSK